MNLEKIGNFIAKARKEKNMTQVDLAKKLGIQNTAISNWEQGIRMPDYVYLLDLCSILDIDVIDLLNGERNTKKDYKKYIDFLLQTIKNYEDEKFVDLITIPGILYINNKYVFVYLLFDNYKEIKESNDKNKETIEIFKNKYIMAPHLKIDNDFVNLCDYENILPLNIFSKIYDKKTNFDFGLDSNLEVIESKLTTLFDNSYNKNTICEILSYVYTKSIELNKYYENDYDIEQCFGICIQDYINSLLKETNLNLEKLYILFSLQHPSFIELYNNIYKFYKL